MISTVKTKKADPAKSHETNRRALIDAGKKVFSVKGSAAATVRDIAKEAGCNVSLISYHFGGKEGLLKACIEEFARQRLETARNILKPAENAEELKVRLELFLGEMLSCFADDLEATRIIHHEMELQSPVILELQTGIMKEIFETFMNFLKAGIKKGILHKSIDPRIGAHLFFSQIHGLSRADLTTGVHQLGSLKTEKVRKQVQRQLLNNILYGALR